MFQASAYEPETEPHLKYDPDNRFETRIQPFFNDGNLKASSRLTWELDPVSNPYRLGSSLVLKPLMRQIMCMYARVPMVN